MGMLLFLLTWSNNKLWAFEATNIPCLGNRNTVSRILIVMLFLCWGAFSGLIEWGSNAYLQLKVRINSDTEREWTYGKSRKSLLWWQQKERSRMRWSAEQWGGSYWTRESGCCACHACVQDRHVKDRTILRRFDVPFPIDSLTFLRVYVQKKFQRSTMNNCCCKYSFQYFNELRFFVNVFSGFFQFYCHILSLRSPRILSLFESQKYANIKLFTELS